MSDFVVCTTQHQQVSGFGVTQTGVQFHKILLLQIGFLKAPSVRGRPVVSGDGMSGLGEDYLDQSETRTASIRPITRAFKAGF